MCTVGIWAMGARLLFHCLPAQRNGVLRLASSLSSPVAGPLCSAPFEEHKPVFDLPCVSLTPSLFPASVRLSSWRSAYLPNRSSGYLCSHLPSQLSVHPFVIWLCLGAFLPPSPCVPPRVPDPRSLLDFLSKLSSLAQITQHPPN